MGRDDRLVIQQCLNIKRAASLLKLNVMSQKDWVRQHPSIVLHLLAACKTKQSDSQTNDKQASSLNELEKLCF